MITKLTIENFLSIKNVDIDFDPGINIFVGESFSGKSNIIRSLEEIMLEPGVHIIRAGEEEACIIAVINGKTIGRVKSNKSNSYYLESIEFSSVGRMIPEDISDLLNLAYVGKGCAAISSQTGPRFLLDESSSVSATELAQISGLKQLLKAIEIADRQSKAIKQKVKFLKAEIEREKNNAKESKRIVSNKKLFKRIRELSIRVNKLKEDRETIYETKRRKKKISDKLLEIKLSLKNVEKKLKKALSDANFCPLSGGEFFEVCKKKIFNV